MNKEERAKFIANITKSSVFGDGKRLRYQGTTKEFKIFDIPLKALIYNVDNGRIASLVKSYMRQHAQLDPETEEGSKLIANFLFQSNEIANKKTKDDILKCGQLEPGIITADGVIVDGNRRASLMWQILSDPNTTPDEKAKCENFRTVVLPENATQKDILRLETIYQLGSDEKVGYNAIEKYLHARDMEGKGFSVAEIEEYMNEKNSSSVQELLEVAELFDLYLEYCDCTGLYTQLPKGCEDDFLKLNTALKKVRSGRIPWIPNNKLKEVENDLQSICFDYIRLNMKGDDDFDFRAILQTSGGNFLQNESVWNYLVLQHRNVVENIEEKDIDALIEEADEDNEALKVALNLRDRDWRGKVKEGLKDAFKMAKDKIDNQKEKEKPLSLLKKSYNALSEIDLQTVYNSNEKSELLSWLSDIEGVCASIHKAIEK